MAANLQKLKLLYIAKMLVEETDAVAGLTMAQILERVCGSVKVDTSADLIRA